jgi:hypothetical protein
LLQVSPRQDLEQMRRREDATLNTPSWVDKERGVARIPIDRAMMITAERGLPEWPAVEATAAPPAATERSVPEPAADTPAGSGRQTPVEGDIEQ